MADMNLFQQFLFYFQENGGYVFAQFIRHFLISIYGVLFASIVGIPMGILISKKMRLADWVIRFANLWRYFQFCLYNYEKNGQII